MIQDLGSSNGTYLNEVRLSQDPTEIKIGDMICLGFNVQAESTHKQISLRIENLNVISTQLEGGNNCNYNNNNNSDINGNGNGNFFINGMINWIHLNLNVYHLLKILLDKLKKLILKMMMIIQPN